MVVSAKKKIGRALGGRRLLIIAVRFPLHILNHTISSRREGARRIIRLSSQLFERDALGLGDEKSQEDPQQHEESIDLHDIVLPRVGSRAGSTGSSTASAERRDGRLCDDRAEFAGGSGDTVRGGAVASWEAFARDDEGGCVRT